MKTKRRPVQTPIPAHSGMGNTTPAPIHVPTPPDPSLVAHIAELESVIDLQTRMLEAQTAVVNAQRESVVKHARLEVARSRFALKNEEEDFDTEAHLKRCTAEFVIVEDEYETRLAVLHTLTVEAATRQIDVIRAQVRMLQSAAGIPIDSVTRDV